MGSKKKNLSEYKLDQCPSGKGYKIGIAVSEWNDSITSALINGARETLMKLDVAEEDIFIIHTPGAFELPVAAKTLLKFKSPDAVICLGCVIKGDTSHDKYINQAVANGITQLSLVSGKPVIFGLLTVNSMDQALERAGGKHGNKGTEAAVTAVKMIHMQKSFSTPSGKIGF
ncbi:MAG: 6,7-dimethyl-8-ribityllumazine synthase [Saprospiraceae bacterium]|nr:6,7-dimethyl-8-ribityllumazine synthase [Saprospiraceae bacterium]